MTTDSANATVLCSVVFADIVGFSKLSVQGQIAAKERFNAQLAAAIGDFPADKRIILDSGDGGSVSFLRDPEPALLVALRLRAAAREPGSSRLRIGINLGPAQIVKDLNGLPNLLGDGINTAERIMSFSPPGGLFVSRSYYEAVSRLTDEYQELFQPAGVHADKHDRPHEVFSVGEISLPIIDARMAAKHAAVPKPADIAHLSPANKATDESGVLQAAEAIRKWFVPFNSLAAFVGLIIAGLERIAPGGQLPKIGFIFTGTVAVMLLVLDTGRSNGVMPTFWIRHAALSRLTASRTSTVISIIVSAMFAIGWVITDQSRGAPADNLSAIPSAAAALRPAGSANAVDTSSARPSPLAKSVAGAESASPSALEISPPAKSISTVDPVQQPAKVVAQDDTVQKMSDTQSVPRSTSVHRMSSPKPIPASTSDGLRLRCNNLLDKAQLGETLNPDEHKLLTTSCR